MARFVVPLLAALLVTSELHAADSRDALARARAAYNLGEFDAALAAAEEARRTPERVQSADLIAARALLERFREAYSPNDLVEARDRLRQLDPAKFSKGERLEFLVGLGEALYLDDQTGAASIVFESVLVPDTELPADARERILDWWATALDRDARPRPELDRRSIYQRIRDRMADELTTNPGSATASYWISAASRGQGDLQSAWDAAQAGWVRSSLAGERGRSLRDDLDELVTKALVPERSRMIGQPAETLTAEWELFKDKWRR